MAPSVVSAINQTVHEYPRRAKTGMVGDSIDISKNSWRICHGRIVDCQSSSDGTLGTKRHQPFALASNIQVHDDFDIGQEGKEKMEEV